MIDCSFLSCCSYSLSLLAVVKRSKIVEYLLMSLAAYLCCAILGCWLTEPMNKVFARRGTIFISCFIAAIASVWEGLANSWVNLFLARFVLGK
jgi:hypothetical protein